MTAVPQESRDSSFPMDAAGNAIVVSIAPQWLQAIVAGTKTIELRRRAPRLHAAVTAYLYETSPGRQLRAVCSMGPVLTAPLSELWDIVGGQSGVSRSVFDAYFDGLVVGQALPISSVKEFANPIPLSVLRERVNFRAPQSWCRASPRLVEFVDQPL
jgi:predicted transcriptional regulator